MSLKGVINAKGGSRGPSAGTMRCAVRCEDGWVRCGACLYPNAGTDDGAVQRVVFGCDAVRVGSAGRCEGVLDVLEANVFSRRLR